MSTFELHVLHLTHHSCHYSYSLGCFFLPFSFRTWGQKGPQPETHAFTENKKGLETTYGEQSDSALVKTVTQFQLKGKGPTDSYGAGEESKRRTFWAWAGSVRTRVNRPRQISSCWGGPLHTWEVRERKQLVVTHMYKCKHSFS